ncbi:ATP-binding protein [Actinobaculum suis]|uniref:ATP-binding protein n=1 Tax=Actinobaculum suis TaxID=1657 RepID=UPI000A5B8B0E|nr:ATP-binding protein [Actinobaculum suis]
MGRKTISSLIVGQETPEERRHRKRAEKKRREDLKRRLKIERQEEAARWKSEWPKWEPVKRDWAGSRVGVARFGQIRATTRTLRTAYPFLAEAGLGNHGPFIGTDLLSGSGFTFDPWLLYQAQKLTNPNITVAGVIGTGKSALCKALVTRSQAWGRNAYIPGDVKGEWSPVARALGGVVIRLGRGFKARLNPLDEGIRPARTAEGRPVDDGLWASMVRQARLSLLTALVGAMLARPLRPEEHTALGAALDGVCASTSVPLIGGVARQLLVPADMSRSVLPAGVRDVSQLANMGWDAGNALTRLVSGDLAGLFDGPSTVAFDTRAPIVSVDLSEFFQDTGALPLLMTCTAAWMESSLRDDQAPKRYVIYDEAHRLMKDAGLLHRMKEQWKLARAFGISNVLVLHRFSDLEAVGDEGSEARGLARGLVTDTSTRIVFGQSADQKEMVGQWLGLSTEVLDQLPGMVSRRGQAVWQVNDKPYFVQDILTRGELELFDTDARMGEEDENVLPNHG